jgi:tetratricopeptide (TPR) repeat protein
MADPVAFRFRAFLSYSHRDKAWAAWLHRALEHFRIDKDLIGRPTAAGPVPGSLKPIFRDRDDFAAGHSLTEQTLAALAASQFLVVICSPRAAQSKYVNEEIRRFKAMGGAARVIAVIVDGEPGHPVHECFPPALRFRIGADGELSQEPEEPIAADARKKGDGKPFAVVKIVAGLLAVNLDDIVRRAERARRRSARIRNAIIAVLLALMGATVSGFAWARHELSRNELLLDRTLQRATELVSKSVIMSEQFGVSRRLSLGILEQAEDLFRDMAELGRESRQLRYRKAWMMIEFARDYAALGNTSAQRARANEAHQLMQGLAAESKGNDTFRRGLSVTYEEIGDVLAQQGNLPEALKSYRDSLAIRAAMVEDTPANTGWQRDLSLAHERTGDVLVALGNLPEALKSYREGLAIRERLAKAEPADAVWQRDLSVADNKIGDVLAAEGDLPAALKIYRDGLAIRERLAKADPANTPAQRNLSVSYERVADILAAQGQLPEALKSYRDGLAISERLATADPANAGWQRDLSVSYEKVGNVLAAQGNLPDALKAYRDDLAIAERLANSDPANTEWQRDLSVSYNKIGNVLLAQSKGAEALKSYRDGLVIRERLAKSDPANASWQRDLVVSYDKVGDVAAAQGNLPEALKSYRDGLAIAERLAKADPANAGWQRDLAVGLAKLGGVLRQSGQTAEALAEFRKGHAIIARLVEKAPDVAEWKRDLGWFEQQLAELQKP